MKPTKYISCALLVSCALLSGAICFGAAAPDKSVAQVVHSCTWYGNKELSGIVGLGVYIRLTDDVFCHAALSDFFTVVRDRFMDTVGADGWKGRMRAIRDGIFAAHELCLQKGEQGKAGQIAACMCAVGTSEDLGFDAQGTMFKGIQYSTKRAESRKKELLDTLFFKEGWTVVEAFRNALASGTFDVQGDCLDFVHDVIRALDPKTLVDEICQPARVAVPQEESYRVEAIDALTEKCRAAGAVSSVVPASGISVSSVGRVLVAPVVNNPRAVAVATGFTAALAVYAARNTRPVSAVAGWGMGAFSAVSNLFGSSNNGVAGQPGSGEEGDGGRRSSVSVMSVEGDRPVHDADQGRCPRR